MHILYIHQHFATNKGSTGTRSYDFARRWVSQGHRVTIVTGYYGAGGLKSPDRLIEHRNVDGIDVMLIGVPYDNRMSYLRRIMSFLKFMILSCYVVLTLNRQHIVFATSTPLTVAIPGLLGRMRHRCPMVFEVRDLWPEFAVAYGALRNPVLIMICKILERIAYWASHSIISISPYMSDRLVQYGVPKKKIHTIPIGTDIKLYLPEQDGKHFRKIHGLENKFICMYVGAISLVNRMDRMLEVAAFLKNNTNIEFVFIGGGKSVEALQLRIVEESLLNVKILPPVSRDQVPEVLAAADLALLSGEQHEHTKAIFPNKLFDYLASGTPVLTNFESVSADLIREHKIGLVLANHTPRQIAQSINDLVQQQDEHRAMGRRAKELAINLYNRNTLADSVMNIFSSALGK